MGEEKILDGREREYFNKQLDGFIKEVQERFHLSYEEALWELVNRGLHLLPQWKVKIFVQNVQENV